MVETSVATLLIAFYICLVIWIYRIGVEGVWELILQTTRRLVYGLIYGPSKELKPKYDCIWMHKTAWTERQVYGQIKSESVIDHLNTGCTKYSMFDLKFEDRDRELR